MPNPQNSTIVALYNSLCTQQEALSAAIQKATDSKLADAIATENFEIMHRMVVTQNLLFQADSPALQESVKAVTDASPQLQTAIRNIQTVTDVVNDVSCYLTLVDEAIDLAKIMAA